MMSVDPLVPASWRERIAVGTNCYHNDGHHGNPGESVVKRESALRSQG